MALRNTSNPTAVLLLVLVMSLACSSEGPATPTPGSAAGPQAEAAADPAGAPPAADPVSVARVGTGALSARISASGSVQARRVTEIAAEVPGRIIAVEVEVGDEVDADAALFRIDPVPFEMTLAEAEAELALARAESANAADEARRVGVLVERKAISEQRHDQLKTRALVQRARVEQAQARVARARRDLERTVVRAPYAGSIVERRAHEGSLASAAPVVVLQETAFLEAILDVPEAAPVPVRPGDPARLFIEGLVDPIDTTVSRVSRRVDPETRTYEVRAEVPVVHDLVKAGSYCRAEFRPTRVGERPVVHRSSLLTRDGRTYVLRIVDGVVRHVPVRAGILESERAEILTGLQPGDIVVRGDAVRRLPDGAQVEVTVDGDDVAATRVETRS